MSLLASLLRLILFLLMPWRWFQRPATPVALSDPSPDLPRMPRLGRPGTATDDQVEALMEARVMPAPPCTNLHEYSEDEAATILDAIAFSRAIASQVTGGEDIQAPAEILTALLNDLVAATLSDDETREASQRWARAGRPSPIREGTVLTALRGIVLVHWQPSSGAPV